MIKSKYLEQFSRLTVEDLPIHGGRILIELLPEEEPKTSGGIIISRSRADNQQAPTVGVVLAVGQGYEDDEGLSTPIDLVPGNIVVVSDHAIRAYSFFPGLEDYAGGDIALAREADVVVSWESAEKFEEYRAKLNVKGDAK